jgi:hypothetical protein
MERKGKRGVGFVNPTWKFTASGSEARSEQLDYFQKHVILSIVDRSMHFVGCCATYFNAFMEAVRVKLFGLL